MRIGIDVMGGDFAPEATVLGAIEAQKTLSDDIKIVLIGNQQDINTILDREKVSSSLFEIVHTAEFIGMHEHPVKSFKKKPNSSIGLGLGMLKKGMIDGFASAGSTGAMLVGAMYIINSIPGIIRPTIGGFLPVNHDSYNLILDVGLNTDSRPDVLYQYGILGSIYAESVFGIKNPKVGLLNIGSEEEKGNIVIQNTHSLMKDTTDFNFVGNVEGNEIFTDKANVIICDGFVGNVVLKQAEAFYKLAKSRNVDDEYFERFNFENYGGTPVLGINSTVIIGHGISNAKAIKNMILQTREVINAQLSDKIKEAFKNE